MNSDDLLAKLEFQDLNICNEAEKEVQHKFAIIYSLLLKMMEEKNNENKSYYQILLKEINKIDNPRSIKDNILLLISRKDAMTFRKKVNEKGSKLVDFLVKFCRDLKPKCPEELGRYFNLRIQNIFYEETTNEVQMIVYQESEVDRLTIFFYNSSENKFGSFLWREVPWIMGLLKQIEEGKLQKTYDLRIKDVSYFDKELTEQIVKF
jgi:hypothetical protein